MEELFSFKDAFGMDIPGEEKIYIAPHKGRTPDGEYIIPVQVRVEGKVVADADCLFFRNNSLADIKYAEKAVADAKGVLWAPPANAKLSRDGVWVVITGQNTVNTAGFGRK